MTPELAKVVEPSIRSQSGLQDVVGGYDYLDAQYKSHDIVPVYLGVQAPDGTFIGTASLRHNNDHGEMANLIVARGYRGLGIGKWLVAERIRRSQELGLSSLHIDYLQHTNPLSTYYDQLGFKQTTAGKGKLAAAGFNISLPYLYCELNQAPARE